MPISPVLNKLLDLLPGERPGGPANQTGTTTDLPGPDPSDLLPPGIAQRVLERGPDALPPGIARQLADFARPPPATSAPHTPVSTPLPPSPPMAPSGTTPLDPVGQIINQIAQQAGRSQGQGPAGPIPMEQAATDRFPPGFAGRVATTAMSQGAAPLPAAPPGQPQQAVPAQTTSNPAPVPGTTPTQAPRTTGNVVPNSVPPPAANANAVPTRTDALPPPQGRPEAALGTRAEQALLDRAAMNRPMGAVVTGPAVTTAQGQIAPAMAQTAQAVPLSQAPLEARGIVLPANDRGMAARAEPMQGTPIYTADGPARRRPRRLTEALPAQLTRWLWLAGLSGNPAAMRDPDPEKDGWFALQWLYWLLAIIAYGCLALALIAMLPSSADVFGGRDSGFSRMTLVTGVVAAAAAWWLARRITRR